MESNDEPILLDDALWDELITLTGGEAAACYQCGVCTAICPWGLVKEETFSVRALIRRAQLGLPGGADALWLCTTCGECEAYCPRGVDIPNVFRALREVAWQRREAPEGLPSLLWSNYWNDNPWGQPPSQRMQWAQDLELPLFDPAAHEILYYVGSTAAYDKRAQQVARALVKVFRAAGVAFGVLGVHEPPDGAEILDVGHRRYFEEVAEQSAELFRARGVTRLVTTSPHSYDVFKQEYGRFYAALEPLHYTQYLAELLSTGRLHFANPLARKITFHDPCYLSRHNDETVAPRRVLEAIPGVELREMENFGAETLCCGGGGGRMWLETEAGERFSDLRLDEALETGAEVLATACPFCIACLEDSVKARGIEQLQVLDIAEIVAVAVES
ncbi:MAG: (Fe-S)-binding protein [Chloroflexota bacterium]|nr:(Fe-S)-binding protein [Chloroflexota bacterium]